MNPSTLWTLLIATIASSFAQAAPKLSSSKARQGGLHAPSINNSLNEIDVIVANGPVPEPIVAKIQRTYHTPDGKYKFIVDSTIAPDLGKWADKELMSVVYEWYPKLVAMLPSDRYAAPETVIMEFRDDMKGVPAYAIGNKLCMSVAFFNGQLEGEAKGCVIHELVHIVQDYWRASVTNPKPSKNPGWVVEGIADYIRWFLYEPQSKGAEIHAGNHSRANYDSSYRITANFLNWVVENHSRDLIRNLNAACREGNYSEKIWKDTTGKTSAELGEDWKVNNQKRLKL